MTIPWQKYLFVARGSLIPHRPYHAQWLLTGRCNYRCRACNVWRENPSLEEIPTDAVKRGLDVLHRLGVIDLVFSGGNPLLRDDIGEIVEYASKFFVTTVYDNGSLAGRRRDALKSADFVAISLDTLDAKKFDEAKGVSGAWKSAMDAVETLKEADIRVGVSPTISRLNLDEIVEFTRHFTGQGVPVWYCLYSYDSRAQNPLFGLGRKADEFEISDAEAMADVCESLRRLKKTRRGVYVSSQTLTALRHLFLEGKRVWRCKALDSFMMIDPLGRVAGCHLNEPVASVLDLGDVWTGPGFKALRKKYSACSRCTYLCYVFYSIHGDVRSNMGVVWDQWKNVGSVLKAGRAQSMCGNSSIHGLRFRTKNRK